MKIWLVLLIATFMCSCILAQVSEENVPQKKGTPDSIYLFFESGTGSFNGLDLLTLRGGLAYEYKQSIMLSAYMVHHSETAAILDASKYTFMGTGVQLGKVFRKDKLKIIPSVGIEFGHIDIGEGPLISDWFTTSYASYHTENAYLYPVSVQFLYKLGRYASINGRFGYAYNWEYPLVEFDLGMCLGKM
ncbi:MAG: hypothetical protein RBS43_00820 [Candidatus Cloacimonas sp.]|jgi:hypothetical protein|nr:hypothetical protein [Candidatus Cloacimonas sp.]